MTRIAPRLVAVLLAATTLSSLSDAQAIDSVTVGMASRYRWRGYDRGSAALQAAASFALGGFATSRSSGDRNNVRFDLVSWNALANRSTQRVGDQYEASASYGFCLAECEQGEWNKRLSLDVAANEYALPNAVGDRYTVELEAKLQGYAAIQRIGGTQLGINLYPYVTVDRDLQRYDATYSRAGIGTYLGPFGAFGLTLDGAVAASDWPSASGAKRSFGYHSSDLQLAIDHDRPVGDRHLSTRFIVGADLPDRAIGTKGGVVTLRFKLSGPVWMF